MYCILCGKPIEATAKFCIHCGNRLDNGRPRKVRLKEPIKASFVISESFRTEVESKDVINRLEVQFRSVSEKVELRDENDLLIKGIAKTFFVSSFRKDITTVRLVKEDSKYLCTAYVKYKMPVFEKILLGFLAILFLFRQTLSPLGFLYVIIAIVCYFTQKNTVRNAVSDVLKRVKNEMED